MKGKERAGNSSDLFHHYHCRNALNSKREGNGGVIRYWASPPPFPTTLSIATVNQGYTSQYFHVQPVQLKAPTDIESAIQNADYSRVHTSH